MIGQTSQYIAVLDTCVLAPMPLCDTLLRLAEIPAFYIPKWSDDILRELRSTLQRMGYTPAQAERRVTANVKHFPPESVKPYDLDVLTPEHVLAHQIHLNQDLFREKVVAQAVARGVSLVDLLGRLSKWAPRAVRLIAD